MKSADEWAKEFDCGYRYHDNCECSDDEPCEIAVETIRAAQRDAIEAAAKLSKSFLVRDESAPWPLRNPTTLEIADTIRSLLPFAQSAPRE